MFTENLQQFNPIGTPEGIKYNGESYRVTNTCAQPVDVALAMAGIYETRRRNNYPTTTPANLLFVPNFLVDEDNGVIRENAGAVYAPSFDLFVFATDNIQRMTLHDVGPDGNELYLLYGAHETIHEVQKARGLSYISKDDPKYDVLEEEAWLGAADLLKAHSPWSPYRSLGFGRNNDKIVHLPRSSSFRPWEVARTVADMKALTATQSLETHNPMALSFALHQVFLQRPGQAYELGLDDELSTSGAFYSANGAEALFHLSHCAVFLPWIESWVSENGEYFLQEFPDAQYIIQFYQHDQERVGFNVTQF